MERLGVLAVGQVSGQPVPRLPGTAGRQVGAGALDRTAVVLEVRPGRVALGLGRGLLALVAHSREYAAWAPPRRCRTPAWASCRRCRTPAWTQAGTVVACPRGAHGHRQAGAMGNV